MLRLVAIKFPTGFSARSEMTFFFRIIKINSSTCTNKAFSFVMRLNIFLFLFYFLTLSCIAFGNFRKNGLSSFFHNYSTIKEKKYG